MMSTRFFPSRRPLKDLIHATRGVAVVEFALSLPVLVGLTMFGAETANMAYTTQRLCDIATLTADSVSRIRLGISNNDVTDALNGIKILGDSIDLRNRGRVIVSSVQPVVNNQGDVTNQILRWQRCTGALPVRSEHYEEGSEIGPAGMGPAGRQIAATKDSELIFVEVYYSYRPLISDAFFGDKTLSALAAMSVRERYSNDISATGTDSPCSTFAA